MNKSEMVRELAAVANMTQSAAEQALDHLFADDGIIATELASGGKVQLTGFGTFSAVARPARNGTNPSNGEPIKIAAKTVVKFKPGGVLAARVA